MLIAQLSDLHLCGEGPLAEKNAHARRAFQALVQSCEQPVLVLVTGDVTENGTAREYALFRELIAPLAMPVLAVPGNHDDRDEMRKALLAHGSEPADGPLNGVLETRPIRVIALDSVIPGQVAGALSRETLLFLDRTLSAEPDVPALIALHHPPFPCGLPEKDSIRLFAGAEGLADILSRHPQAVRVVAGHHHRALQATIGGVPCQVAPPVRYLTRAERGEPEGEDEPSGYLLHRCIPEQGLVTQLCPLTM